MTEHDVPHGDTGQAQALHVHVVPVKVLAAVFAVLLVLTVLTVAATYVDLGRLNIWIALFIAVAKASAVGLYFMHLRYDKPFYGIILVGSLLFVVLFIGTTIVDTLHYKPDFEPPGSLVTEA
jgi:cytochrome c oxidase subunit 4